MAAKLIAMPMPIQVAAPPSYLYMIRKSSSFSWFNSNLTRRDTTRAINNNNVVADRLDNEPTPWLMLPPEVDPVTGDKVDCFYSLSNYRIVRLNRKKSLKVADTARCISSTTGSWLGFADTKDGSLYLSNPFLNDVAELPSLGTIPQVVSVEGDVFKVSFLDYEVPWDDGDLDQISMMGPESMVNHMISHIALSSEEPRNRDCIAMAIQGDMKRLAYCHIGKILYDARVDNNNNGNNKVWYGLQEDYLATGATNQVVYNPRNSLLYYICQEGIQAGIQAFDVQRDRGRRSKKVALFRMDNLLQQRYDATPKWLKKLQKRRPCSVKDYLLTLDNGDLWLIVRHLFENYNTTFPYKTHHFDVFRVVYPGRIERVHSLGDRAIFIGSNQSFCIKTGMGGGGGYGSPKIRSNSIYFTDDHPISREYRWGHDMGIFNIKDGVITQFYPYHNEQEEKKVPIPVPLFWIPPLSRLQMLML